MNLRQTAETAALASAHSALLIEGPHPLSDAHLLCYWQHSKRRLSGWVRFLNRLPRESDTSTESPRAAMWRQIGPVLAEVFVSEILTRVWATVLTAADRRRHVMRAEPIVRSVSAGQAQARHLALSLLVGELHVSSTGIADLDRIRRRTERWTDLLLGHLVVRHGVDEFAFDVERAADFGRDHLLQGIDDPRSVVWDLILSGLRRAFPATQATNSPEADHHRGVLDSVLAMFPEMVRTGGRFDVPTPRQAARDDLPPEGPPAPTLPFPSQRFALPRPRTAFVSSGRGVSFAALRRLSKMGGQLFDDDSADVQ